MKSRLMLLAAVAVTLVEFFTFAIDKPDNSRLDGVWQLTQGDYGGGAKKPQFVQLKVLHEGKFESYVLSPDQSAKTMNGKFDVVNDSVYTETLIGALNKPMIGKTYEISYSLNGNVMVTKGTFDVNDSNGLPAKGSYVETWTRVDYPAPNH